MKNFIGGWWYFQIPTILVFLLVVFYVEVGDFTAMFACFGVALVSFVPLTAYALHHRRRNEEA